MFDLLDGLSSIWFCKLFIYLNSQCTSFSDHIRLNLIRSVSSLIRFEMKELKSISHLQISSLVIAI